MSASPDLSSHECWFLMFALSANPYADETTLQEIISLHGENYCYKNVIRNIVRNTAASPHILAAIDYGKDPFLEYALKRRSHRAALFSR